MTLGRSIAEKRKGEAEETENGRETDGANGSEMEEESPMASPSSEAEQVEGSTTEEVPRTSRSWDGVFQGLKYQKRLLKWRNFSEAESRLPEGEAATVEERTVEGAEEPIPDRLSLSKKPFRKNTIVARKDTNGIWSTSQCLLFANFPFGDEEFFEELEELS